MVENFRSKKRNRPSFVCTNCRKKKIKCDKQNPCYNCVKHGIVNSCKYASSISYLNISQNSNHGNLSMVKNKSKQVGSENPVWKARSPLIIGNAQIESFRSQASNLEDTHDKNPNGNKLNNSFTTSNNSDSFSSILDLRINALKLFTILKKHSRTYVQGPLSFLSCSLAAFVSPTSTELIMNFFEKERNAWKRINGPATDLGALISSNPDLQDVVNKIRTLMTNSNYNAISERLLYFRDHLNFFLYNGFVDIPHVLELFNDYFKITEDGEVTFLVPSKNYKYSDLSMIFSLIESVILFTRNDTTPKFNYQITKLSKKQILELATETLALSNFHRKENFSALISMILLRDNRYKFAEVAIDSMDQTKSSYIFKECVLLAIQLGLHRDPSAIRCFVYKKCSKDTVYQFPAENSAILWSHLKFLDAYYSSYLGTPLMISEIFCDSAAPSILDFDINIMFTNLQREASILLNSVNLISLRNLINIRKKFLRFNSSIGTFKELFFNCGNNPEKTDRIAQKLIIKIRAFTFVSVLNSYLWIIFTNTSIFPADQLTIDNVENMKKHAKFFEFEYARSNFISWKLITTLTSPDTIFFGNSSKYLVFLKTESLQLLNTAVFMFGVSTACHYGYFQSAIRSNFLIGHSTECDPINVEDLDFDEIELSLSGDPRDLDQFPNILDARLLNLIRNPTQTTKFLSEIHYSISKTEILSQNYGYFCTLKMISIFCCFSDSILKLKGNLNYKANETLDEVIEKTKDSIKTTMKLGIIDKGFSLPNDEETISNWLDAFFDQNIDSPLNGLLSIDNEVNELKNDNMITTGTSYSPFALACFFPQ